MILRSSTTATKWSMPLPTRNGFLAQGEHTCVEFVEKLFPTALISEDTKSLEDVQKQEPLFGEISSY